MDLEQKSVHKFISKIESKKGIENIDAFVYNVYT